MNRVLLCCTLIALAPLTIHASAKSSEEWDLATADQASTHIFYGELLKSIPEPNFKTGVMGVDLQAVSSDELPMQPLIWSKAKEFTFSVNEPLKGTFGETFVAYLPDTDLDVWPYVQNDMGDVFLARPEPVAPLLQQLRSGDSALYFIRYFTGSSIPVVYRARFGQRASDDMALLRAHKAAGGSVSLQKIQEDARARQQANAAREAARFRVFEDEYYKILRIKELDIRVSLLKDLVARMGFEGKWTYQEYKERYLQQHGAYLENGAQPPGPTEGREKLWHDISGELEKIEFIEKARANKR